MLNFLQEDIHRIICMLMFFSGLQYYDTLVFKYSHYFESIFVLIASPHKSVICGAF
jgi:hypothetical protein